jgi:DNA ligase-1
MCPNLGLIAAALLAHGPSALASSFTLRPGIPVQPMLANPATGVAAALKKVGAGLDVLAEFKYDGERAQVHLVSETEVGFWFGG